MLRDITIGQYYPVDSPVHRLDPRVKLAGTFLFIISIFFVNNAVGFLLALAMFAAVNWQACLQELQSVVPLMNRGVYVKSAMWLQEVLEELCIALVTHALTFLQLCCHKFCHSAF